MRVESYQEDDMRKAMAKVRAELGKDAVIISSRRVAGRTEIMAASDYDPQLLESEIKKLSVRQSAPAVIAAPEPEPELEIPNIVSRERRSRDSVWEILSEESVKETEKIPSLFDMQEELGRLRQLFEGELAQLSWRDAGKRQPNRTALLARLEDVGISRDISDKLVEKVLPCEDLELAWKRVLRLLGRVTKISELDILNEGGVIALLGPTGVGKTTTAAKIAAQFALRHGRKQVAFITTDNYRVGGQEQLISLGSILGIPVQVVNDREEMQKTLESFSQRKLVIIDTAGISQRDTNLAEQFEALGNNHTKIHSHLVLSATSQESVINETIKAFSSVELSAAIITKTDESYSLGPILSSLLRHKLPTAFIGNGQQVPEDLLEAEVDLFMNNIVDSYEENKLQQKARQKLLQNKARRKKAVNV